MFVREKRFENHGGELKEVTASDKKGLWIGIGVLYGMFAVIAIAGIFVFIWGRQTSGYGVFSKMNITEDIRNVIKEYEELYEGELENIAEELMVGEQTVTYYKETEEEGLRMKETMTMQAYNDVVYFIKNVIEMDLWAFDSETQSALRESFDELVEQYRAVEGVTCTKEDKEDIYILLVEFEVTEDVIKELTEQELFEFEGEGDISLEDSAKSLEEDGYMKIEE